MRLSRANNSNIGDWVIIKSAHVEFFRISPNMSGERVSQIVSIVDFDILQD
jgi:hypothetical protein